MLIRMYVASERRAYILRLLEQRGQLRSAELARELMVTDETIRTDLVQLQKAGLLQRVHGGAVYMFPQGGSSDGIRLDCQLAERVALHLQPGMRVYLDPAPRARALASQLGAGDTLLTPSPAEAVALATGPLPYEVELPGGRVRHPSGLLNCEMDDCWWQHHLIQMAVLYPDAVEPDAVGYGDPLRACWAERVLRYASSWVVVAPAAYLGRPLLCRVPCRHKLLITENHLPPGFESIPVETVPYIDAHAVMPEQGFDY